MFYSNQGWILKTYINIGLWWLTCDGLKCHLPPFLSFRLSDAPSLHFLTLLVSLTLFQSWCRLSEHEVNVWYACLSPAPDQFKVSGGCRRFFGQQRRRQPTQSMGSVYQSQTGKCKSTVVQIRLSWDGMGWSYSHNLTRRDLEHDRHVGYNSNASKRESNTFVLLKNIVSFLVL